MHPRTHNSCTKEVQTSYLRQRTNISVTESTWKTCPTQQQHIPTSQKREGQHCIVTPCDSMSRQQNSSHLVKPRYPYCLSHLILSIPNLQKERSRCLNEATLWLQDCINRTALSQRICHEIIWLFFLLMSHLLKTWDLVNIPFKEGEHDQSCLQHPSTLAGHTLITILASNFLTLCDGAGQ